MFGLGRMGERGMRTWTPQPEPFYWRHPDWELDITPMTWAEHDANRDKKFEWHLGELWDLLGDECERRGYVNEYRREPCPSTKLNP